MEYLLGKFKSGTDGKVAALEVEWATCFGNMYGGKAAFKRVLEKESVNE